MKSLFKKRVQAAPAGYSFIGNFDPNDVFVVGYPKSGNTWFQGIIASVLYGVMPEFTPRLVTSAIIPDVQYSSLYQRHSSPMFFKSHLLPQSNYRRVVYLLRDGRDTMVSYYHYIKALGNADVDLMQLVRAPEKFAGCKWHEHVEAWRLNPFGADILTIKYEELKSDLKGQIKRFCDFVGIRRDSAHLDRIIPDLAFAKFKIQEELDPGLGNPLWPVGKKFFRRGEAGAYKNEMTIDVEREFMRSAAATMDKEGYSISK